MLYSKPKIIILKLDKPLFSKVIAFRKVSIFTTKHLFYYVNYGKIIVGGKVVESQVITRFQTISRKQEKELKSLIITYFQQYDTRLQLHSHLARWKGVQGKIRLYRKEEFCYDGYLCDLKSKAHTIMYITDYKYNDRQSRRRLNQMQSFISRHCFDSEISFGSISHLILNKTNSKCVNTDYYVKNFENYILQEINIIRPTIIVALGCSDIVQKLFDDNKENENLSAISNTPIVDMLPLTTKVNDHLFQAHFEYIYFRKFGWNI
jgi:hypothetical protein